MEKDANGIRGAIAELGRQRRNERIPEPIRTSVRRYASRGRARGASWRELSTALGVSVGTLQRLTAEERGRPSDGGRMVAVSLQPEPVRGKEAARGLVLVTARGMRLEGLDLAEAAELLRALA